MNKWKSRCTAWIACLAILAAAFLPSMSAALVPLAEHTAFTAPICSVHHVEHGLSGPEQTSTHHDGHAGHCPLCAKQGYVFDILAQPDVAAPPLTVVLLTWASASETVHSETAWMLLPSRAPPAHS